MPITVISILEILTHMVLITALTHKNSISVLYWEKLIILGSLTLALFFLFILQNSCCCFFFAFPTTLEQTCDTKNVISKELLK